MGSASDNHRCPLCGRVGNGGYAADGWNCGPVCTGAGGKTDCLWRPSFQNRSAEEILLLSLDKVMCGQLREAFLLWSLPEEVLNRVDAFLLR